MTTTEFSFETKDHLQLLGQVWVPQNQPVGLVCLIHGLGEHVGRYHHVGEMLNLAGYVLAGVDLRGHGRSPGIRGHAPGYDFLMDDIERMIEAATSLHHDLPVFLYGHSLGGNLVLNYLLIHKPGILGAVVTGPALRTAFKPPALKVFVGKLLYRLMPGLLMHNELDRNALSRDSEVVRKYNSDPLVHDRVSVRLALDTIRQGEWAIKFAPELKLPVLLAHGSADQLTSLQASLEFAANAGKIVDTRIWEGLYHEIHNEPEHDLVLAHIVNWMDHLRLAKA